MNRIPGHFLAAPIAAAMALLSACGGGSGGGGSVTTPPPTEVPEVTAVGTPTGPAVTQNLPTTGGTVVEPATDASVKAEAGAFGSATDVTVQPVTDTLPSGIGDGVMVTPAQTPGVALIVTMPYGSDVTLPDQLGLAAQEPDGSWQSLEPVRVDTTAGTISAALQDPPAAAVRGGSARAKAAGTGGRTIVKYTKFYLKPGSATVHVKRTVTLTPYVLQSTTYCPPTPPCDPTAGDDCLLAPPCKKPVVQPLPFLNDKPGYTHTWKVDNVVGGNSTLGTISPNSPAGATFTAPAVPPDPHTVDVYFVSESNTGGGKVFIMADVTITADYAITADFTGTQFPVCAYMVADVHDRFGVNVKEQADGSYSVADPFSNIKSTLSNQVKRPGLLGSAVGDSTFDIFTATGGQVTVISGGGSEEFLVSVTGPAVSSACSWTDPNGQVTSVPSTSAQAEVQVDFSSDGFDATGKQTLPPLQIPNSSGVWTLTVEEQ